MNKLKKILDHWKNREVRIHWKDHQVTTYTGRNGTFKCIGLHILNGGSYIVLAPINSKDTAGHCFIDIPVEDLDSVINALKAYKDG